MWQGICRSRNGAANSISKAPSSTSAAGSSLLFSFTIFGCVGLSAELLVDFLDGDAEGLALLSNCVSRPRVLVLFVDCGLPNEFCVFAVFFGAAVLFAAGLLDLATDARDARGES